MPLLFSKKISAVSAYAVWNIQETNQALEAMLNQPSPTTFRIEKAAEWMVGRILIKGLCEAFEIDYQGIEVLDTGKPRLKNRKAEISITHSFPMAAAMIHLSGPCGIDLERPRHKMLQVRDKFINGSEKTYADDLDKLCAIWCAKEVLYKIYGRKKLSLKDDTNVKFLSHELMEGTILKSMNGYASAYSISIEEVKEFLIAYNR